MTLQVVQQEQEHKQYNAQLLSTKELFDKYRKKTYKSLFTFYLSTQFCKKVLLSYY